MFTAKCTSYFLLCPSHLHEPKLHLLLLLRSTHPPPVAVNHYRVLKIFFILHIFACLQAALTPESRPAQKRTYLSHRVRLRYIYWSQVGSQAANLLSKKANFISALAFKQVNGEISLTTVSLND